MKKPEPRTGLLAIDPYKPGKSTAKGERIYKLSSNESALGASPAAIAAYRDAADKLERYPDGTAHIVREAIAKVHDLDPDRLIIGAGSDEIITLLIRAYAGTEDNILQTDHGFSYYALAAQGAGVETIFAPETQLTADPDKIVARVTDRTRIVFLANPNNPTGTVLMAPQIRELRQRLRSDVMLVLDGAYAEYMDDPRYTDGRDLVDESIEGGLDNVVMMRTFSKIYGLGGLRVGWAYAAPSIIDVLHRVRPPFNVNAPALAAAAAAMLDEEFVARNRTHNADERERVGLALTQFGFAVTPSFANFILFEMRGDTDAAKAAEARALLQFLEDKGVLVRATASSNLPHHIRVSIGDREANDAFLSALGAFIAG